MEALILISSIFTLLIAAYVAKVNVSSWNESRRTYQEAMEIKALLARANEFMVACNTMNVVAEKVTQQARVIDRFATKVIDFDNLLDGQYDYLVEVLTNRAVNYADFVTNSFTKQITDKVEATIIRSIPELLMAKAGGQLREYVVVNTLDGLSVNVDLNLRHIPGPRFRKALVRALSNRPLQGKPSEAKAAQRYVDGLFGSQREFEIFLEDLGIHAMDETFSGDLVLKAVPTDRKSVV